MRGPSRQGFKIISLQPLARTSVTPPRDARDPASIRDSRTRSHAGERGEPARSTATSPQTSSMNLRDSPTSRSSTCLSGHSDESPAQEHASMAETAPKPLPLVPSSPAPSRTAPSRSIRTTVRGNRCPNYRHHSARWPGSHWTGYSRTDQERRRGGWTVPTPTSGAGKCDGSSRHSKHPLVTDRDRVPESEPEPNLVDRAGGSAHGSGIQCSRSSSRCSWNSSSMSAMCSGPPSSPSTPYGTQPPDRTGASPVGAPPWIPSHCTRCGWSGYGTASWRDRTASSEAGGCRAERAVVHWCSEARSRCAPGHG